MHLKIQTAKPDYLARLQKEWDTPPVPEKVKKVTGVDGVHSEVFGIVVDSEPLRIGWKRGKFNRPVCVMNVRDPITRKNKLIDPSKMQHNLKRFNEAKEVENDLDVIKNEINTTQEDLEVDLKLEKERSLSILDHLFNTEKKHSKSQLLEVQVEMDTEIDEDEHDLMIVDDLINEKEKEMICDPMIIDDLINEKEESISELPIDINQDNTSIQSEEPKLNEDITINDNTNKNQPSYTVNTNLRSLIFGETKTGFSLFKSKQQNENDNTSQIMPLFLEPTKIQEFIPIQKPLFFETSKLFFMHVDEIHLKSKSLYDPDFSFKRTHSMDDIERYWEATKKDMTDEYKRKHKSATKKNKSKE